MQLDTSLQILRKQRICETIDPFYGELSKMHDAEVHVFLDSVLHMGEKKDDERVTNQVC